MAIFPMKIGSSTGILRKGLSLFSFYLYRSQFDYGFLESVERLSNLIDREPFGVCGRVHKVHIKVQFALKATSVMHPSRTLYMEN